MGQAADVSVCIAGATGWTGRALVRGVLDAPDMTLRSAVGRSVAGRDLGEALGGEAIGVPVHAAAADALEGVDVVIDYPSAEAVKPNTLAAIEAGVGRDGAGRGAPRRPPSPHWEVIDYASATKPDVPSGTARELAERLGEVRHPQLGYPIEELHGPREARGATVAGTQVHSVRVPSFVVSTEVVFRLPDERLTIRHDAGSSPEPYVAGTLLAARRAPGLVGLTRGLDTLLLAGDG